MIGQYLTINEIGEKTAENVVKYKQDFPDNPYYNNIIGAAENLIAAGRSQATYVTQYSSGNSAWDIPNVGRGVLVTPAPTIPSEY